MSAVIVTSCVIRTSKGETLNSTSSFDALEVFGGIEVILTPSPTVSFAVEGNERAKSKLEMRVDNGTLRIEADGLRSGDWLKIRLSAPVPEKMTAYSGSRIINEGTLNIERLDIRIWNNASIALNGHVAIEELDIASWNSATVVIGNLSAANVTVRAFNESRTELGGSAEHISVSCLNNATVDTTGLN